MLLKRAVRRADARNIDRVIRYWLGTSRDEIGPRYSELWFTASGEQQAELDAAICCKFLQLLERAESGKLDTWSRTPRGAVSLILLLDQISRHAYRHRQRTQVHAPDSSHAIDPALTHTPLPL